MATNTMNQLPLTEAYRYATLEVGPGTTPPTLMKRKPKHGQLWEIKCGNDPSDVLKTIIKKIPGRQLRVYWPLYKGNVDTGDGDEIGQLRLNQGRLEIFGLIDTSPGLTESEAIRQSGSKRRDWGPVSPSELKNQRLFVGDDGHLCITSETPIIEPTKIGVSVLLN